MIDNIDFTINYDVGEDIDPLHYFYNKYKEIPFIKTFNNISINKIYKNWNSKYKKEYFTQTYKKNKKQVLGISIFIIKDGIIGFISKEFPNINKVQILHKSSFSEDSIKPYVNDVLSFIKKEKNNKSKIEVLFQDGNYSDFKSFDIKSIDLSVSENYNDDFLPIHNIIVQKLSDKNANGLVILYGTPGTGKTHYLRYLSSLLDKKKLFIPSNMASSLANPDFLSKLEENKGSILIIEDADEILSRKGDGNTAVANLLSLSDGLLADILNIQIICTFNSPITIIDEALIRKGRVIAKYEFKALNKTKAQKLSNKLGSSRTITNAMVLSDIYNYEDKDFNKASSEIGF